ncbi:hypothetical protein K469DRAFT_746003 [Zopfia rhizophila CBS 207.26]|uniref:RRM domain-containing protein n=1 Tax=Zopfia rhizophila CBS 207.26 TaxID=1314779 RepID=A0A6A6EPB2_9PEZI|nr:hypothetical protein K469DRAFT_746003 [Zopfia rhizophila CBS 207.26]
MSASGSRAEDYMLVVSGFPQSWGWQEFKDNTRKVVKYQPGWTDVLPSTRQRGEKQGWCRIERKEDADSAYDHYAFTTGALVHLFRTSRSGNGGYRGLKCNCSTRFLGVSEGCHSPARSGIDASVVNECVYSTGSGSAPQFALPSASPYPYGASPQAPTYACAPHYPYYAAPMQLAAAAPVYSASTSGMPVNVRHGAILTEARGIFISNLNYAVGLNELNTLLNSVGRPIESKLHQDSRTSASKGIATAKFATKEEAQSAVAHLNGCLHMGMTLKVRLDTETTVVGQVQGPLVVNGSNVSRT